MSSEKERDIVLRVNPSEFAFIWQSLSLIRDFIFAEESSSIKSSMNELLDMLIQQASDTLDDPEKFDQDTDSVATMLQSLYINAYMAKITQGF